MGAAQPIRQPQEPTLGEAIGSYLATPNHAKTSGTARVYGSPRRQLAAHLDTGQPVTALEEPKATAGSWTGSRAGGALVRWRRSTVAAACRHHSRYATRTLITLGLSPV